MKKTMSVEQMKERVYQALFKESKPVNADYLAKKIKSRYNGDVELCLFELEADGWVKLVNRDYNNLTFIVKKPDNFALSHEMKTHAINRIRYGKRLLHKGKLSKKCKVFVKNMMDEAQLVVKYVNHLLSQESVNKKKRG